MSNLTTTKKQTHILVRRDKFSAPMDRGTSSVQAAVASVGLSSTKRKHAENVLHVRRVQDQKRKGSFTEANTQNTTKGT